MKHEGTALPSRPARAIMGLKFRTGLETRPHIIFINIGILGVFAPMAQR